MSEQLTAEIHALTNELAELQEKLERLKRFHELVASQRLNRFDDPDGSSVKAVHEYYAMFRRGATLSASDAAAYAKRAFAEDVEINSFTGRSIVMDQWKTHSFCCGNVDLTLLGTMVIRLNDIEAIVRCTTRYSFTVTRLTLTVVFPHILDSPDLVNKLIGRRIVTLSRQDLTYNCEACHFNRFHLSLGLLDAFAEVLPNPFELEKLFRKALVTDEFYIGEVDPTLPRSTIDDNVDSPSRSPDLEETKGEAAPDAYSYNRQT